MISVVIPLYNKAHCIEKTIRSVLSQTFQDFEIVVVNDGSTDNGPAIVAGISDSRIKLINQENKGVSVARNIGIENSKYQYISLLDGDDEWLPGYLENVLSMIEKYPNAGLYFTAGIVRSDGFDHFRVIPKLKNTINKVNFFEAPFVYGHTSSSTINKSLFNRSNKFPYGVKNFQDFYLFTDIATFSDVIYSGTPLSIYNGNIQGQATSITNFETKLKFRARYINENTSIANIKQHKELKKWIKIFSLDIIYNLIRNGNYKLLDFFLSELKAEVKNQNLRIGQSIYPQRSLKHVSLGLLILFKIMKRLNNAPRLNLEKGKIKSSAIEENSSVNSQLLS